MSRITNFKTKVANVALRCIPSSSLSWQWKIKHLWDIVFPYRQLSLHCYAIDCIYSTCMYIYKLPYAHYRPLCAMINCFSNFRDIFLLHFKDWDMKSWASTNHGMQFPSCFFVGSQYGVAALRLGGCNNGRSWHLYQAVSDRNLERFTRQVLSGRLEVVVGPADTSPFQIPKQFHWCFQR